MTAPTVSILNPGNQTRYQPISDIRLGQFSQLSGIVVGVSGSVKKTSKDGISTLVNSPIVADVVDSSFRLDVLRRNS